MHKVFVYGTLRPEGPPTHFIMGYQLFDFGRFPAIKEGNPAHTVRGNVLRVSDEELEELDRYESTRSGLYTRESVRVFEIGKPNDTDGEYVYAYVGGNIFPQPIESGDWFTHIEQ